MTLFNFDVKVYSKVIKKAIIFYICTRYKTMQLRYCFLSLSLLITAFGFAQEKGPDFRAKSGTYYFTHTKPIELKWGDTRFFRDSTYRKPNNHGDTTENYSINSVVDPQFAKADISVFPNPFIDIINIRYEKTGDLIVELMDVTGKYAMRKTLSGGNRQLDLRGLAGATYLLRVFDADAQLLQTFKIEKVSK